ncbi:UNVERIFIED_CONTAM: hypothetical protein N8J90_18330 [Halobacillus marinus]|uniref:hypothetical protein n=1 Tax=Bacillaceae TaxID=186817 RepID=UPI0002A50FA1|nr:MULTISPECIES: hypothetical protein [Bacillaceae]ELK48744.1 hypothetical protein D479_01647 [Halobacillus sp. BAB-2008]QHT48069.1 hypothetical protein M662_16815 [Bacillus sp. SB49]
MSWFSLQLPGPLQKYERVIRSVIKELGIDGWEEEYIEEGVGVVMRMEKEQAGTEPQVLHETTVYHILKDHFCQSLDSHS